MKILTTMSEQSTGSLLTRPETICVRILRKCNLTCTHCWASSSPHETEELDAHELMRFLGELRPFGLKHVSLSGGEPFLYRDLPQVVRACLELGLFVSVTTNGFMGTRFHEGGDFRDFPKDARLRVRVSIDGVKSSHDGVRGAGSHGRAIAATRAIKSWQGWVGVNTVVLPSVYGCLDALVRELHNLEVNEWALMAPLPKGRYRGSGIDAVSVQRAVMSAQASAARIGFRGRVRFWDFHIREHGHLVLESDGRILMPGFTEETDRLVGDYRTANLPKLMRAVAADAERSECEFYSWRGWSLTST
jgi:sulfatase maturation enzyme AslB (radical SAM superfamily)